MSGLSSSLTYCGEPPASGGPRSFSFFGVMQGERERTWKLLLFFFLHWGYIGRMEKEWKLLFVFFLILRAIWDSERKREWKLLLGV